MEARLIQSAWIYSLLLRLSEERFAKSIASCPSTEISIKYPPNASSSLTHLTSPRNFSQSTYKFKWLKGHLHKGGKALSHFAQSIRGPLRDIPSTFVLAFITIFVGIFRALRFKSLIVLFKPYAALIQKILISLFQKITVY